MFNDNDRLFWAVRYDNVKLVEEIIASDKKALNERNELKFSLLHQCAFFGSEKVFDWLYPKLNRVKLNVYDNYHETPFHKAVVGPSDKIFKALLTDDKVDVTKCQTNISGTISKNEAIFQLVMKPSLSNRVKMYFDHVDSIKTTKAMWYEYVAWNSQLWAVKEIIESGDYESFDISERLKGARASVMSFNKDVVNYIFNHDPDIFIQPTGMIGPIEESLRAHFKFEYLMNNLPDKLDTTKNGNNYDYLIQVIFTYRNMEEYLDIVNKKDILISDDFIKRVIKIKHKLFFKSCELRSDYHDRILPILIENDTSAELLPQDIQDIFLF